MTDHDGDISALSGGGTNKEVCGGGKGGYKALQLCVTNVSDIKDKWGVIVLEGRGYG